MRARIAIKKIANAIRQGTYIFPNGCLELLYKRRRRHYKRMANRHSGMMRNFYIHKMCSEVEIYSEIQEQIDSIRDKVEKKNKRKNRNNE